MVTTAFDGSWITPLADMGCGSYIEFPVDVDDCDVSSNLNWKIIL
jgi:hypothetical protein